MRYFSADLALTPSFCPVWYTVAGYIRALLSASWLIFHNDIYLQRNLVTRYAMLRKSHTISRLGLRANKGMEQRRLGSSLKSRMGTRPLKFFWVTTSRVPMLWKGKSWEKGKEKGKRKERTRKKEKDTCDGVYPKSMGRKENQKIRLKKKKEWATTERKRRCREVWTEDQTEPAQSQEEKGRREVKIRKESCIHQSKHTQAEGWLSMFTLSQLAKRSSMPPACCPPAMPHMLQMSISE